MKLIKNILVFWASVDGAARIFPFFLIPSTPKINPWEKGKILKRIELRWGSARPCCVC